MLEQKNRIEYNQTKKVADMLSFLALSGAFWAGIYGLNHWLRSNERLSKLAQERCGEYKDILVDEFRNSAYCCQVHKTVENEKGEYELTRYCKNISLR